MHFSLIKKIETVDNKYKKTFANNLNNIRLKRNKICVQLNYRIQFANVDYNAIFSVL